MPPSRSRLSAGHWTNSVLCSARGPAEIAVLVSRLSVVGGLAADRRWCVDGDAACGIGAARPRSTDGVGTSRYSWRARRGLMQAADAQLPAGGV